MREFQLQRGTHFGSQGAGSEAGMEQSLKPVASADSIVIAREQARTSTAVVEIDAQPHLQLELDSHSAGFNALRSFESVLEWDAQAKRLIERAQEHIRGLEADEARLQEIEAQSRLTHERKSFLARIFSSEHRRTMSATERSRALAREVRDRLRDRCDLLRQQIDMTPDSREEKKLMLQELKAAKKELAIRKREIAAEMRDVRANASVQMSNVGTGFSALFGNERSRRYERMGIRLEKEAKLMPHKEARAAIEAQLTLIERHIIRLEAIS